MYSRSFYRKRSEKNLTTTKGKLAVLRSGNVDVDTIIKIAESATSSKIRVALAGLTQTPDEILEPYLWDSSVNVRVALARRKNVKFLEVLAEDENEQVVTAVAFNPHATEELLNTLMPSSLSVKRGLANNRNTSFELLRELLFTAEETFVPKELIIQHSKRLHEIVSLDDVKQLPLVSQLAVAEYCSDSAYTDMLSGSGNQQVLEALARNHALSMGMLRFLVKLDDKNIIKNLVTVKRPLTFEYIELFLNSNFKHYLNGLFNHFGEELLKSKPDLSSIVEPLLDVLNSETKKSFLVYLESLLPSETYLKVLFYESFSTNLSVSAKAVRLLTDCLDLGRYGDPLQKIKTRYYFERFMAKDYPEIDFQVLPLEWLATVASNQYVTVEESYV